jgi:uncharacterized BrkB/YihY/UPF0761 family membrane protein
MQPQRLIGVLLIVIGIVLLVMGIRAMDSFSSQFSKFFTGSPTDRAVWLTLGGSLAILLGLGAGILSPRAIG